VKRPNLNLNKKAIINTTIGLLIAQNMPVIANKLGLPASGLTGNVVTAIGSIVIGKVMKKPEIATIGVSFAIADIANSQVLQPALNSFVGNTPAITPGVGRSMAGVSGIRAYTATPNAAVNNNYMNHYLMNN